MNILHVIEFDVLNKFIMHVESVRVLLKRITQFSMKVKTLVSYFDVFSL